MLNFNHSTSMVEIRLNQSCMAVEPSKEGGRFELETEDEKTPLAETADNASSSRVVRCPNLIFILLPLLK